MVQTKREAKVGFITHADPVTGVLLLPPSKVQPIAGINQRYQTVRT